MAGSGLAAGARPDKPRYLFCYLFSKPLGITRPQLESHNGILTAVPRYEMIIPQASPLEEIFTGNRGAEARAMNRGAEGGFRPGFGQLDSRQHFEVFYKWWATPTS